MRGRQDFSRDAGFVNDNQRGNSRGRDLGTCFWCGKEGHHQATCTNPPFCYRCKDEGHIAAACPKSQGCSLNMRGFAIPGQGFYSLSIPGISDQKVVEFVGLLQVVSGEATVERIEEELKKMIDSKWNWKVRKVSESDYLAVFPSKEILNALSLSKGIEFSKNNISVNVSCSKLDPNASSSLQTGWVKISNIPQVARNVAAVKLIAELAGDVVAVDEVSLIREGPVRVKMNVRNLSSLRGFIEIFIGRTGYDIRFLAEDFKDKAIEQKRGSSRRDEEEFSDDEEEEYLRTSDSSWKHGKSQTSSNASDPNAGLKSGYSGKQQSSGGEPSLDKVLEVCEDTVFSTGYSEEQSTLGGDFSAVKVLEGCGNAPVNPDSPTDLFQVQDPSLLWGEDADRTGWQHHRLNEDELRGGQNPPTPTNHFKVHSSEGIYFMEQEKWPKLIETEVSLPEKVATGGVHSVSEVEEDVDEEDFLLGSQNELLIHEEEEEWEEVTIPNKQKQVRKKGAPVLAIRRSARKNSSSALIQPQVEVPEMETPVDCW
ncbi:hypothetical protein C2845_PM11G16880 [Panicum miliaceum]|uniref:CCHC-type domain-containing protein n=1 Tax=Panicum miliaceum TaxID=4540 RepID=A0A3L6RND9_PANMI|nr:hypothetical protein C2845_PM11G16880 [Panicum miliaceum]